MAFGALKKGTTGVFGGAGVGADDDFFEDMDIVTMFLHEEHAHRVNIEIERPDERQGRFETNFEDVCFEIEGEIGTVVADGGELGFKFAAEDVGIHFAAGGFELGLLDKAAFFGSELKGRPVGVGFGEFEVVIEMVAAFGGTDEEGAALAVGERGAQDVGPSVGFEVGDFVEDDEIEAVATQGLGIKRAFEDDGGIVFQVDAAFGFERLLRPEVFGDVFETTPDDAFALFVGRADVPDEAVG